MRVRIHASTVKKLFAKRRDPWTASHKTRRLLIWVTGVLLLLLLTGATRWVQSSQTPATRTIAFIPRAAGSMLWEVARLGATKGAENLNCHIYWNAPTTEADAAGQISLIEKVTQGKYGGLVLAPNHTLAMLVPVRRALSAGLPVVLVSAPLDLPANEKLGYIVNDDEKMGELAAAEAARLVHGRGPIALVGLTRSAPGIASRVRSAERYLASRFPDMRVLSRLAGAYDTSQAQELTDGALDAHPGLRAIVSFTATSTRGAHAALKSRSLQHSIRLIGCEQDSDLISSVRNGDIAAVLAENTYRMGYEAVGLISASWAGKPMPAQVVVPPMLITRDNADSAEANHKRFTR